jgi:hypothetical protein
MMKLSISTKNFKPNTKLSKTELSNLEDRLEDSELDRDTILDVATIVRDNTLAPLTETELDRMIYMLKEKKGSIREIQSIVLRAIMMAIPSSNGGSRLKRKTYKRKINKRSKSIKRK